MVQKTVTVKNPTGLHLRPAGELCRAAMQFQSRITLQYGHTEANAKSILSVLATGVRSGEEILFICEGEDEAEALDAMVSLVEEGLGE